METDLYEQICKDIDSRKDWALKQPVWYSMRRDGIRRKRKPWPNAADMHYPLIDTIIDKLKPFYLNQLFATERLADFISKDPTDSEDILSVSYWFDYKLKHESNLEDEINLNIDAMLVYGRGIVKAYWDVDEKRICYDAIEPLYVIVPDGTKDIRYAERLVHVMHLSLWDYKNGPFSGQYNQDPDFIKQITGSKDALSDEASMGNIRRSAEGITHSTDCDTIVLWEVYERMKDKTYKVHTISPVKPREDVRPPFMLSYKSYNGECISAPFVDFVIEKTAKNYYSPRGASEILAVFESSMNRMWNGKHDSMSIFNQPILAAQKDVPITQNIRAVPGQILPFPVQAVQMGAPPISYDQEMANTRSIAEQRIATPDFGIGDRGDFERKKSDKTATETEAIMSMNSAIVDMRSRLFRKSLGKLYVLSWDILMQFDEGLDYMRDEEFLSLPKELRERVQSIKPNGSSDSWNIQERWKKAARRKAMLGESRYIKQWELDKTILELDEPGLVERLFLDPQEEEKHQAGLQMKEFPSLMMGFPLPTNQTDDDAIHIGVMIQFIVSQTLRQQQQPPPDVAKAIQTHLDEHFQKLKQSDPKKARELQKGFQDISRQIAQQKKQQGMNGQQPQMTQ